MAINSVLLALVLDQISKIWNFTMNLVYILNDKNFRVPWTARAGSHEPLEYLNQCSSMALLTPNLSHLGCLPYIFPNGLGRMIIPRPVQYLRHTNIPVTLGNMYLNTHVKCNEAISYSEETQTHMLCLLLNNFPVLTSFDLSNP